MNEFNEGWRRRLVICLGLGLILACLCNGAGFYLKKIGALDYEKYQAYWVIHCTGSLPAQTTTADPCAGKHPEGQRQRAQAALESAHTAHLYEADGAGLALKLVKDVLSLTLLALSVAFITTRRVAFPRIQSIAPALVLLTLVSAGFFHSWVNQGGLFAVLGLRSFIFLAIAVTAGWLARDLPELVGYVYGLLALQVLLLPVEFAWGMHIHGHFPGTSWPIRLSGTLVSPNSLGIFAVIALAFVQAFARAGLNMPLMHVIAALLVLVSGSATGWITLIMFWGLLALSRAQSGTRLSWYLVLVAAGMLVLVLMPTIVGRPDLFDSVFGQGGRLDGLVEVAGSSSMAELLWGRGIGSGTNTAMSAYGNGLTPLAGVVLPEILGAGDSTITSLLGQLGLAGVVAFYGMLSAAFLRQRRTRAFYLVVAVSSLTINIPELFPANILLGIALAAQMADRAA